MLERRFEIRSAYHHAPTEHAPHGSAHCADMVFSVGNPRGWITWTLYTGWELSSSRPARSILQYPSEYWRAPTPGSCDYHSPTKPNDWAHESKCHLLGTCWSDGTSLTDDLFELLIAQGTDGLWAELERRWHLQFGASQ